jgi:methyl-accepting chemotaxis protein
MVIEYAGVEAYYFCTMLQQEAAMATVSSTTSVTGGVWQQIRSQQAQRAADQASQVARALQSQASDARAAAQQAQDNARSLEIMAGQAQGKANQARMGLRAAESIGQAQTQMADVYTKLPEMVTQTSPVVANAATTVESIGTVINTTA